MYPVLFEIRDAWTLPGEVLVAEIVVGLGCGLAWLALHLKGRKDGLASALNLAAFLIGLHLVLSWFMEEDKPITIYSFGVIIILGFFAGSYYMLRQTRPLGLEDRKVFDWAFWLLVCGIAGSRLLYAMLNFEHFSDSKLEIFRIWNGGLVWYGGLIPAAIVGIWLLRKHKLPVLHVADIGSCAVILALGMGRWACLLAGDDYGRPTDAWYGIRFHDARALIPPALRGVPLHPTQLYMSVNCLWIFFALDLIRRRGRFAGQAFAWMLILYAVTRMGLIEPLRGDFVERNPGYARHIVVALTVPAEHAATLERGLEVVGEDGRKGRLLEDAKVTGQSGLATAHAISTEAATPVKTSFGATPPAWTVRRGGKEGEEVAIRSGSPRWYGSDLPVPPGYVSTSQWISLFVVAAGVAMLVLVRRLKEPGFSAATAA